MENNIAESVADIVTKHLKAEVVDLHLGPNGQTAQVLILPRETEPWSVKSLLEEYLVAPERRRGQADLADLASFIAHVQRFADEDSILFAIGTAAAPSLLCVFDYHRASKFDGGSVSGARFCEHRARYLFPLSDEWKAWTAQNGKAMDQAGFAEWIENRIADLGPSDDLGSLATSYADKTGATFASVSRLFELSKGLQLRVASKYTQHKNLANGETAFMYASEHQDETGAPLKVPGTFTIEIPVFKGGEPYQIPVRLRYRVKESAVVWFFELYRHDVVFEDALQTACTKAKDETKLPLLYGAPES